jgi:beta-glucosidase
MAFPKQFQWGVATSSYQIEGAPARAGGGRSVWDMFVRRPGSIAHGDTAEIACDHYGHYQADVALMAELGLQAYRFSISWPRVMPASSRRSTRRS